jgi:putative tricarboxylic transport membrane protein
MENIYAAFGLVLDPYVIAVIIGASFFGMFMGAVPGLSATMAVALLVPLTFFMEPVPAIAAMVSVTAMAIFAGDIPGCLLRIPGTPSSAAYTNDAYLLTMNGKGQQALGASLVFSVVGGLFGTTVLIFAAPALAEVALKFSSFEYFWLVALGLTCAIFIASSNPLNGFVSLFIGMFVACVGMNNPAGLPRFTFDNPALLSGVELIPMMVGMFAVSEVLRFAVSDKVNLVVKQNINGNVFKGTLSLFRKYPKSVIRGNLMGMCVGILPGAGADIAAWMAYAMSQKMSKTPELFGTGHVEGIVEAGSANNASLAGAWIPALVFGIPGDSLTAIIIGVLYMKNLNPGPMIFVENPVSMYAIFIIFILANLLMLPLGLLCIKMAKTMLSLPRNVLMPLVMLFCIVGAFATNNSTMDVVIMLIFGLLAYFMEENKFPVAPAVLGLVLGNMLEGHFVTSMIKADGNFIAFFERPIAGTLGVITIALWFLPVIIKKIRNKGQAATQKTAAV